jgi:hypothetical protein
MRRFTILGLVCVAALAPAQQLFTYRDHTGTLTVHAKSGLVEQVSTDKVHLVLKGNPVVVNSVADGLQIEAPSVVCDTNTRGAAKIGKAVGTGGVHSIKRGATGTTDITSSSGTYTSGTQSARLDLRGAVRIISKTVKGSTTITGHDGNAILANGAKGPGSGLRTASLLGPVRVESVQQNTKGGTIVATGSRLLLDNAAHTVTLIGNVNVTGNQQSTLGELRGADRAVLVLNDRGQIASVRVSQGGK